MLEAPVRLEPVIALDRPLAPQLVTLERLHALIHGHAFRRPTDPRLARLVIALRALDARAETASLREVAIVLFDNHDWPGEGEWMKSRVRRLLNLAEHLQRAGLAGILQATV